MTNDPMPLPVLKTALAALKAAIRDFPNERAFNEVSLWLQLSGEPPAREVLEQAAAYLVERGEQLARLEHDAMHRHLAPAAEAARLREATLWLRSV